MFVTGASDNHFSESQDVIGGIQKYYPDRKIFYFDLGLSDINRNKVRFATGKLETLPVEHVELIV